MPGKTSKEKAEALLKNYRLGQCSPGEIEIINRWYESHGRGEANILMDTEKQAQLKEEMLRNIHQEIDESTQTTRGADPNRLTRKPVRLSVYRTLWKVAAVLSIGIAASFYFYSMKERFRGDKGSVESVSALEEISVDKVIKSSAHVIYLSDGSVVWLKSDSHLEYPERFNGTYREVTLSGEAFFDVAANPRKPFIIHSTNFTTRVLGTSFNISDYGDDDAHEVVVVDGKVMVSINDPLADQVKELVLSRNKKVVYFRKENILTESDAIDVPVEILNKRRLAFEEVKLGDIIKVVNAEYNVNISLSHERMYGCVITADLTDMSLGLGLEILSKAINATYDVGDERNIVISGDGCEN